MTDWLRFYAHIHTPEYRMAFLAVADGAGESAAVSRIADRVGGGSYRQLQRR